MSKHRTVFEVLKNADGAWFWHERAGNGEISNVAQAYASKRNAKRAATRQAAQRTGSVAVKVLD